MGRPKTREEDKCKPNDKLNCEICGMDYSRSNKSKHIQSKFHKLAEKITTLNIQQGGNQKKHKHRKLSNRKRRLKKSDTDSENSTSEHRERRTLRDRCEQEIPTLNMPNIFHDYIHQKYGELFFKREAENYFNDPNISYEEKIRTIDEIAEEQGKKYNKDIYNNVQNSGNPQELLQELRDPEKRKKFFQF